MATLSDEYNEYIGFIRDNEDLFIEEISTYDIKETLVHLRQLKNLVEFGEHDRDQLVQQIGQINVALGINIDDWKKNILAAETALESIRTWTPGLEVQIKKMQKVEQDIALVVRIMDFLLNRIEVINTSHTQDKESIVNTATVELVPSKNLIKLPVDQDRLPRCSNKPECPTCTKWSDHTLSYCINTCVMCSAERKIRNKIIVNKVHDKVHNEIEPIGITLKQDGLIPTNDKIFFVTLTSNREDGTNEYIEDVLLKNFRSMFPDSFPARSCCYVIGLNADHVPYLNGLIRYDCRGRYRISPKSTHIKNMIVSMNTGARNLRYYNVINLTKYSNKRYQTRIHDVKEKYLFMSQQGNIIGNTEVEMLS
jgi:hypothetical protein